MDNLFDAVVVGGGVAGLTAAAYLARARYRVALLEKERFGGQINITDEVANYPGVERTSGAAIAETLRRQAMRFGAELVIAEAETLELSGDVKTVRAGGVDYNCFGIVLATGARPRQVGFKGEAEFQGRGVAYCATCDGEFFTGKDVFVVGGGFAAAEESVFLTRYARHVTILVRKNEFRCAESAAREALEHEKITVLFNTEIEEVAGDSELRFLRYRNNVTGETTEYRPPAGDTFGVFVFAGYVPETALLRGRAEIDAHGYVVVDRSQRTSLEGVYAAGDVCGKNLRQMVTAAADGAVAATELERYAAAMQRKTGLTPIRPVFPASRTEEKKRETDAQPQTHGFFTDDMREQLADMFARMATPLVLRLTLDQRPVSDELKEFMNALAGLTDKLTVTVAGNASTELYLPCVRICRTDGTPTGIAFHGVPGGHEFTSFALSLYNAAGPGQALEAGLREEIKAVNHPVSFQILVSLSCAVCPDTVKAAQHMASENPLISAEAYDLNHFPELKERYTVMSVPCVVINGSQVSFGKKNIRQLLDLIR